MIIILGNIVANTFKTGCNRKLAEDGMLWKCNYSIYMIIVICLLIYFQMPFWVEVVCVAASAGKEAQMFLSWPTSSNSSAESRVGRYTIQRVLGAPRSPLRWTWLNHVT